MAKLAPEDPYVRLATHADAALPARTIARPRARALPRPRRPHGAARASGILATCARSLRVLSDDYAGRSDGLGATVIPTLIAILQADREANEAVAQPAARADVAQFQR